VVRLKGLSIEELIDIEEINFAKQEENKIKVLYNVNLLEK